MQFRGEKNKQGFQTHTILHSLTTTLVSYNSIWLPYIYEVWEGASKMKKIPDETMLARLVINLQVEEELKSSLRYEDLLIGAKGMYST